MKDFTLPNAMVSGPQCPQHGSVIYKNGMPFCLHCAADEKRAAQGPVVPAVVEDPGAEALMAMPKLTDQDSPVRAAPAVPSRPVGPAGSVVPFTVAVENAIKALKNSGMPPDMKAFKTVQKVVENLQKLLVNPGE